MSGLKVNFFKSEMIGIRLNEDRLEMIADFLSAKQGLFPHPIWVFLSILEMPPNPFGLQ